MAGGDAQTSAAHPPTTTAHPPWSDPINGPVARRALPLAEFSCGWSLCTNGAMDGPQLHTLPPQPHTRPGPIRSMGPLPDALCPRGVQLRLVTVHKRLDGQTTAAHPPITTAHPTRVRTVARAAGAALLSAQFSCGWSLCTNGSTDRPQLHTLPPQPHITNPIGSVGRAAGLALPPASRRPSPAVSASVWPWAFEASLVCVGEPRGDSGCGWPKELAPRTPSSHSPLSLASLWGSSGPSCPGPCPRAENTPHSVAGCVVVG